MESKIYKKLGNITKMKQTHRFGEQINGYQTHRFGEQTNSYQCVCVEGKDSASLLTPITQVHIDPAHPVDHSVPGTVLRAFLAMS